MSTRMTIIIALLFVVLMVVALSQAWGVPRGWFWRG
jgi:hypothetical protein